jgi:hypothetical protein
MREGFFHPKKIVPFVPPWILLVALIFCLCVSLKLNGSSLGVWQTILREPGPPPGLLLFKPRWIRSDEWDVTTPSMLSQARQLPPFPIENPSLGAGRAPLLMSVPVAYYTTLFRPQLWGFFIFDFERGFSFYWCCKIFGLLLASVWLLRRVGIKNPSIVAFGTLWIFFSSFVQWWFSSPAMLPEMIACWAMLTGCALSFFSDSPRWRLALVLIGFVFFGINFTLCLYPGFQIPLLYVSVAILAGIWIQRRSTGEWRWRQGLGLLCIGLVGLVLSLIPFWLTVHETLKIVAHTSYPGVYRNSGGGLRVFDLFSGVLGFFESENRPPFDYANICEASNFYPLWIAVLAAVVVARWQKRITIPGLMITLAAAILLLSIYCVVPMPAWLARASLLALTTEGRLLLGIGIANIVFCCIFFDSYRRDALPSGNLVGAFVGLIALGIGLWAVFPYAGKSWLICIVTINALIVGLFFWSRARQWFLVIFSGLVIINGAAINPVMSGLSPLLNSHAYQAIEKLHAADPPGRWIVYENVGFAQLVTATGAPVLNGTKIVPDLAFLHQLDPDRQLEWIYNRYAYINVALPDQAGAVGFAFKSGVDDAYQIRLPPDLPLLKRSGYCYLLFPRPWLSLTEQDDFSFLEQIDPSQLYIYKRKSGSD